MFDVGCQDPTRMDKWIKSCRRKLPLSWHFRLCRSVVEVISQSYDLSISFWDLELAISGPLCLFGTHGCNCAEDPKKDGLRFFWEVPFMVIRHTWSFRFAWNSAMSLAAETAKKSLQHRVPSSEMFVGRKKTTQTIDIQYLHVFTTNSSHASNKNNLAI